MLARIAQHTNCNSKEAWSEALTKVERSKGLNFPVTNLAPVLWRYLAWQASTSAVEQNFSKADFYNACGRSPASAEYESRTLRLLVAGLDVDKICRDAQVIYSVCTPASKTGRPEFGGEVCVVSRYFVFF